MITNYEKLTEDIRSEVKNFLVSNRQIKTIVLGISGGIDSALVAALIRPVCDEVGILLIGRSITISTNKQDEINRSKLVSDAFCHNFKEVDLSKEFEVMSKIDDDFIDGYSDSSEQSSRIRMGNIKARMRMIYLYNLASKNLGVVFGTENKCEENIGFFTIGGDEVSDFEPIKNLWKTEVYNLSEYLAKNNSNVKEYNALMSCIECDATDGLGISNTDLDQILPDWKERHTSTRGGYGEVDNILMDYIITVGDLNNVKYGLGLIGLIEKRNELEKSLVIKRHLKTEYKRNRPFVVKIDRSNL